MCLCAFLQVLSQGNPSGLQKRLQNDGQRFCSCRTVPSGCSGLLEWLYPSSCMRYHAVLQSSSIGCYTRMHIHCASSCGNLAIFHGDNADCSMQASQVTWPLDSVHHSHVFCCHGCWNTRQTKADLGLKSTGSRPTSGLQSFLSWEITSGHITSTQCLELSTHSPLGG